MFQRQLICCAPCHETTDRVMSCAEYGVFFKLGFLVATPKTQYLRTTHKQKYTTDNGATARRRRQVQFRRATTPPVSMSDSRVPPPVVALRQHMRRYVVVASRRDKHHAARPLSLSHGSVARRGTSRGVVVGRRRQWGHRHFAIVNGWRTSFASTLNYWLLGCAVVALQS